MSEVKQLLELQELARQKEIELEKKKESLRQIHKSKMEIISQLKKINEEIRVEIEKRNELNQKVKDMKEEISKILVELQKIKNDINERDIAISKLRRGALMSESEAKRRLAELEWRLVTEPLNPKIESSIVSEIERLRSVLALHEKAEKLRSSSEASSEKVRELKSKLDELRTAQRASREQANDHHKRYIEMKERRKSLLAELNRIRNEEVKLSEEKDALFMELVKCNAQAHLIASALRMKREQERFKRRREEWELKTKVANEIAEKLKRGERLSFDELKIYYEVFGGHGLLQ